MFGDAPGYKQLDTPHKQVHDNISRAMKLVSQDPANNADEIIALFKDTEKVSHELFKKLDELIQTS
jgi:Na+/phosphate symporter